MQATETKITTGQDVNTYDETPYESCPFSQTKVEHLKSIAQFFDLNSPNLETARVLELGCAAGGNLIPQAIRFPKGKFVGVDLSAVQTKIGQDQIKALGLKNIEIKTMSITDVNESMGEFDYIICHGVISWVPAFVRDGIFDVCSKLLSKTGVAYISYNTLPGWNMVRSIRDMMLYHTKDFAKVEDKVDQSFLLLEFIKDSLAESQSPYGEILKAEANLLTGQGKYYLRHDHLEDVNYQYYFHQFMQEADKRGLQYLGDALLSSMYIGNMPAKMVEKMQEIKEIVQLEQYMDFVTNRRFRSTILCRKNVALNRNIDGKKLANMFFSAKIQPETPLNVANLEDNSEIVFFHNNSRDSKVSTTSPTMKALFYVFSENGNRSVSIDAMADGVMAKLPNTKLSKEAIKEEMTTNMLRLIFSGYINASIVESKPYPKMPQKPKMTDYCKSQFEINKAAWVTNNNHDRVSLNIFDNFILRYLDGTHTQDMVLDKVVQHVKDGQLTVSKEGQQITDEAQIKSELSKYLGEAVTRYLQEGLLIGE